MFLMKRKKRMVRERSYREFKKVKTASLKMAVLNSDQKNSALEEFAKLLLQNKKYLLKENEKDLIAQKGQISTSLYQRLELTAAKISQLAQGMRDLAKQEDPCGKRTLHRKLDEGLILQRVSVPIGVLGIIFESRPDAVPQILSLVLKSGNASVLKGGKEAFHSNRAIMTVFDELQVACPFLPAHWSVLLESREDVHVMLRQDEYIDLVIPRGSNELVQAVMQGTKIPVLGHAAGICHLYIDKTADQEMALKVLVDSKTQYPSACNALETLLIDSNIYREFIPKLEKACSGAGIFCKFESDVSDWSMEYGEPIMSVKSVDGAKDAILHINQHSSHHTDAIMTEDQDVADQFISEIDSSSVIVNASTRFADGFRYGMGAEVGISTSKTHARGPVGIEGLVIYKYVIRGSGQVVSDYSSDGKRFIHEDL